MQRAQSKQSHQQSKTQASSLDTFFRNYTTFIEDSHHIQLDLQKLVQDYNEQVVNFPANQNFPVKKEALLLSKEQIKILGTKLKSMGQQKLLQTMTNIEKLNTKLNQDYATEINHAIDMGLLERQKISEDQ